MRLSSNDVGPFEGDVLVEEASIVRKPERSYATLKIKYDGFTYSAKRWNYNGELPKLREPIFISGKIGMHAGDVNFIIDNWYPSEKTALDFVKYANINTTKYYDSMIKLMEGIDNPKIREFTLQILEDHKSIALLAPAAVSVHHAYVSGWLEHTVEVLSSAIYTGSIYGKKGIKYSMSLIIAGAILHDIGKLRGYGLDNGVPVMTTEGQLYDHIVLGSMILEEYRNKFDLTGEDLVWYRELMHIVLSHHGELEYGSPVKPATPEAYVVHNADMLSSKLNAMHQELNEMTEPFQNKKSFMFGTRLYNSILDNERNI